MLHDASPTWDPPAGRITGVADGDVVRALGIPYARAERFRPPEPIARLDAPYAATTPSPVAPQSAATFVDQLLHPVEGLVVDEHCQRLSITAPADLTPGERLPVVVWIHGGSYVLGGGDLPIYDARELVTEQRLVFVSVTFRLGFLGDGERVPANLGLLDLVEALRWVRANIAAFGGDPEVVTVAGQSAGGDAAAHLMISAGTRVAGERAAVPFGLPGGMPYGVQYGFAPLPAERDTGDAWRAVASEVDVLIGSATDETGMYVPLIRGLRSAARLRVVRPLLRWLLVRPLSWVVYGRDVDRFTARHRAAGGSATSYRLLRGATAAPTGAVHMSDLPLLLGGCEAWAGSRFVREHDWPEVERRGWAFRAVWAEFVRTGRVTAADDDTRAFDRDPSTR